MVEDTLNLGLRNIRSFEQPIDAQTCSMKYTVRPHAPQDLSSFLMTLAGEGAGVACLTGVVGAVTTKLRRNTG